jgi:hypothetical protein
MKALMALGAILGFLIGTGFALAGRTAWPGALWNASAAALVASLLMRWWGQVWVKSLHDSIQKRRAESHTAPANAKPSITKA